MLCQRRFEVDEDALCGFGAEVGLVGFPIAGSADDGQEHEVEGAGFGECAEFFRVGS